MEIKTLAHPIEALVQSQDLLDTIGTVIFCFSTGNSVPEFITPLDREPLPKTGLRLDNEFATNFRRALALNPAIHDGAILFNRMDEHNPYHLQFWSCRLFPPNLASTQNKGVAWNSCQPMSLVEKIDFVILYSSSRFIKFLNGEYSEILPLKENP